MEWVAPRNVDEVRFFMGFVGYYRRFIWNFSQIAYPILSLHRKGKKFEWMEECESSFVNLKQLLTHAQVLEIANPRKEFLVCTYACEKGLGRVLIVGWIGGML